MTAAAAEAEVRHGARPGIYGYKRRGCRCPGCTAANTAMVKRYRARHPERDFSGWARFNGVRPARPAPWGAAR